MHIKCSDIPFDDELCMYSIGELSVEELMQKYAGAYDSDFEMPGNSSGEDVDSDDDGEEDESSGGFIIIIICLL